MTDVRVKLVETHHEMEACVDLRVRVFVDEQGSPLDEEIDEYDRPAVHAAAILDGRVVGTGRLYRPGSGETQIGRMAVDPAYRRRGIGSLILSFLEEVAISRGDTEVVLHAQTYVTRFYERHTYVAQGGPFMEAGIEHVKMVKSLEPGAFEDES